MNLYVKGPKAKILINLDLSNITLLPDNPNEHQQKFRVPWIVDPSGFPKPLSRLFATKCLQFYQQMIVPNAWICEKKYDQMT
jgi:hypothetical protein